MKKKPNRAHTCVTEAGRHIGSIRCVGSGNILYQDLDLQPVHHTDFGLHFPLEAFISSSVRQKLPTCQACCQRLCRKPALCLLMVVLPDALAVQRTEVAA